jgi:hypothetical protein
MEDNLGRAIWNQIQVAPYGITVPDWGDQLFASE